MRKKVVASSLVCLVAASAFATISKDEVKRLQDSARVLIDLRNTPEKGISESLWLKAQCALVVPSMKKAAFVVGGQYGAGVMSCRKGNDWSAPVFMKLEKGSVGLQIGGEAVDIVLLVMNRSGIDKLLQDKVSLGADASVAAGPVGRTATAETDAQMKAEMLSYSRSSGVFAGIDLAGGVLKPDKDADARAYGEGISARDVLLGTKQVTAPPESADFLRALRASVRGTSGQR